MVAKPTVGGSSDTWGSENNAALDDLQDQITSNAQSLSTQLLATGLGAIVLNLQDTSVPNQLLFGSAARTGKTAATGDAALKIESSDPTFRNDRTHDWNLGILASNWTAGAAAISVGNSAAGDGIFVEADDTSQLQAIPPNALNVFAGSLEVAAAGNDSGTATATGSLTLTDTTKSWATNQWAGRYVVTPNLSSPSTAKRALVVSNTNHVLTHTGWTVTAGSGQLGQTSTSTPSGTTAYVIPPSNATGVYVKRLSSGRALWLDSVAGSGNAGTGDEVLFIDDAAMTAGALVSMRQGTAAFTGDGIKLDMGNDGGSHTGHFVTFNKAGTTVGFVDDDGSFYARGDASGAPSSGAHVAGQAVTTKDGHVWVCSASGTPGTWRDLG